MSVKSKNFEEEVIDLANFAKALAHPARIMILKVLAEKNICMCGEIVDELPLAQSTVSQHLKELKNAGIIQGEIEGPKMCYCINKKTIETINTQFNELFGSLNNNCC
ncbi:MAG TPA: metalloregulator ArsR/SmtB family transcription factor [Ignavibacteriaceae bacterium]|nr:metalloregulator ArsR/SmtB family transcription factor [Ignavibacteriaceae bacterium]